MASDTVNISRKEYEKLKEHEEIDKELLQDISKGIKDILDGKLREV